MMYKEMQSMKKRFDSNLKSTVKSKAAADTKTTSATKKQTQKVHKTLPKPPLQEKQRFKQNRRSKSKNKHLQKKQTSRKTSIHKRSTMANSTNYDTQKKSAPKSVVSRNTKENA